MLQDNKLTSFLWELKNCDAISEDSRAFRIVVAVIGLHTFLETVRCSNLTEWVNKKTKISFGAYGNISTLSIFGLSIELSALHHQIWWSNFVDAATGDLRQSSQSCIFIGWRYIVRDGKQHKWELTWEIDGSAANTDTYARNLPVDSYRKRKCNKNLQVTSSTKWKKTESLLSSTGNSRNNHGKNTSI